MFVYELYDCLLVLITRIIILTNNNDYLEYV